MAKQVQETSHNEVFNSAKKGAVQYKATIALIASICGDWSAKATVKQVAVAYELGYFAGLAGCTRSEALAVFNKREYKGQSTVDDKTRTPQEHKWVRASLSSWSHVSGLAGKPSVAAKKRPSKTPSTPKTLEEIAAEKKIPVTPQSVLIPRVKNESDAGAFLNQIATMLRKFENENAKGLPGEYRNICEAFIAGVRKLNKPVEKAKAKPVAPKVSTQAPVLAEAA